MTIISYSGPVNEFSNEIPFTLYFHDNNNNGGQQGQQFLYRSATGSMTPDGQMRVILQGDGAEFHDIGSWDPLAQCLRFQSGTRWYPGVADAITSVSFTTQYPNPYETARPQPPQPQQDCSQCPQPQPQPCPTCPPAPDCPTCPPPTVCPTPPKPCPNNPSWIWLLIVGIALLAAIGGLVWMWLAKRGTKTKEETEVKDIKQPVVAAAPNPATASPLLGSLYPAGIPRAAAPVGFGTGNNSFL
jgi:hypothetical protein